MNAQQKVNEALKKELDEIMKVDQGYRMLFDSEITPEKREQLLATLNIDKEEFKKNPSRYEPQYGGWCAYAMGKDGSKVEVDPETFKIIDGKLYLYYNKFFNNTLKSWNKDEPNLKAKADVNWKQFYH